MALVSTFRILPCVATNSRNRHPFWVRVQSSGGNLDPTVLSSDSIAVNGISSVVDREKNRAPIYRGLGGKKKSEALVAGENVNLKSRVKKKRAKDVDLEVLWDDGYGTKTVKDYLDGTKEMIRPDGGPPRWFCPVDCGQPLRDFPILLFLPGNC